MRARSNGGRSRSETQSRRKKRPTAWANLTSSSSRVGVCSRMMSSASSMQSIIANSGTDFSLSMIRLSINQFAVNVLWGGKSVIIRRRSCLYQSANDHRSWCTGCIRFSNPTFESSSDCHRKSDSEGAYVASFRRSLYFALGRPERMKSAARRYGKLAALPGLPKRPHEGVKANCQFALPFLRSQQVAAPRSETMKIDRIYKIYRMSRKILNPVNLVNPVYSLRGLYVALRRPGRMKSAVRSPAFWPRAFGVTEWIRIRRFRLKAGLRTATVAINRASKFNHRYATL